MEKLDISKYQREREFWNTNKQTKEREKRQTHFWFPSALQELFWRSSALSDVMILWGLYYAMQNALKNLIKETRLKAISYKK